MKLKKSIVVLTAFAAALSAVTAFANTMTIGTDLSAYGSVGYEGSNSYSTIDLDAFAQQCEAKADAIRSLINPAILSVKAEEPTTGEPVGCPGDCSEQPHQVPTAVYCQLAVTATAGTVTVTTKKDSAVPATQRVSGGLDPAGDAFVSAYMKGSVCVRDTVTVQ